MFGVVFPNRSFPMDISTFAQIDTFHWVLDMNTFVGEAYDQVRDLCIFLLNGFTLPPEKALAVYIQSPGSAFVFCGAVTVARPSAVLTLAWPEPGTGGPLQLTADTQPLSAKIGVSVEDLASLPSLDVAAEKRIERLAMKVGENLFNFMQSFCGVDGSKLVVPMDILDRWFKKFQERAKRDPEYLKGFALVSGKDPYPPPGYPAQGYPPPGTLPKAMLLSTFNNLLPGKKRVFLKDVWLHYAVVAYLMHAFNF